MLNPDTRLPADTGRRGTTVRNAAATSMAGVGLLTSLYLCSAALDGWAAKSFAQARLAATLVAVLEAGLFAAALCLAPPLSLLVRLLLGGRTIRSAAVPEPTRFLLAAASAAVVVLSVDFAGWVAFDGAAPGSLAMGVFASTLTSAAGGVLCGALIWALALAGSLSGPAADWTTRPIARAASSPIVLGLALVAAGIVLAAGVLVRTILLSNTWICAALDVAILAAAFVVFLVVSGFASGLGFRDRVAWRWGAGLLLTSGVLGSAAAGVWRPYLVSAGLIDLVHLANAIAFAAGIGVLLPARASVRRWTVLGLLAFGGVALFLGGVKSNTLRPHLSLELRPARWFLMDLPSKVDFDDDGSSPIFGGDCDDFNPFTNPAAVEIPGNGIDDDCRDGDRRVPFPWKRRPTFVPPSPSLPPPQRVLLVVVDSLRADRVSSYGYRKRTTPNLDRLAQSGVRFANAYSASPLTCFAFPILFTGRSIPEIQWNHDVHPTGIRDENTTLAEVMRGASFRTAAFLTYYAMGKPYGMVQGFDHVDSDLADPISKVYAATTSEGIVDRAIRWIEKHRQERWFVFVHLMEPHSSYLPHEGIPDFGKDDSGLYDGEVFFADRAIGRLLSRMTELGLDRETAVVAMGDHGEMLGAHGQQTHGSTVWQEVLRIPILVSSPGLEPRVSPCVTSHADIAPTILNLVGIDGGAHGMTASSLVPDLLGSCDGGREIVAQLRDLRALVGPKYKLIHRITTGTQQLFDLTADPEEKRDLSGEQPVLARQMLARLMAVEANHAGVQITDALRRSLVDTVPERAQTVDARFSNGIELLAIDMGSRRLTTNEPLRVALYLRAARRVQPSCQVRVLFMAGKQIARLRGQGLHQPLGGALPFEFFPLRQLVEDVFYLAWRGRAGRMSGWLTIQCGKETVGILDDSGKTRRAWVPLGDIEVTRVTADGPSRAE